MSKIGILGTGSWATALARVLHDNGHQVLLYGIDQNQIDDINMNHQNSQFFGDVVFEEGIKATNDLKETIKDAQYLLITIPTQFVKDTLKLVKPLLDKKITIINASKEFDLGTNMRTSDTIRSSLFSFFKYGMCKKSTKIIL